MSEQEWAIQDVESKKWWRPLTPAWGGPWGEIGTVFRFSSYHGAVDAFHAHVASAVVDARIVPAPPCEMTDAEAWDWLKRNSDYVLGWSRGHTEWWVMADDNASDPIAETALGTGAMPCDAIRAAARKLGTK